MSQQSSVDAQRSGTPFLQDIPILGGLMRASAERNLETHVVFAVQARILRSPAEDRAESIRARLALERSRSRVRGLRIDPAAPYAILLDTRSEQADAIALA